MVNRHTAQKIRKTHRYLGLFIGIQFLIWTISGLYFSWTDIDEIHGDDYRKHHTEEPKFTNLENPSSIMPGLEISSLELKEIAGNPYYLINREFLIHAKTGEKKVLSQSDAIALADKHMIEGLEIAGVERLVKTNNHHEYRGGKLPAYVLSFKSPNNLKAYVSIADASFESIRHRDWRWFDFLWMTHTMDYEGSDDFNNLILRGFSLLGLITVFSGFLLWYTSSPSVRKIFKKIKNKQSR